MGICEQSLNQDAPSKMSQSDDHIEQEVLKEMRTLPLEVPSENCFEPRFKKEDLHELEKRDQRMLENLSTMSQKLDWCIDSLLRINADMRNVEAVNIRERIQQKRREDTHKENEQTQIDAQKRLIWQADLTKWAGATLAAAIVGCVFKFGIDKLFK